MATKKKRPWSAVSPGWGFPDDADDMGQEAAPPEEGGSEPPYIPPGVAPPEPEAAGASMAGLEMLMGPEGPREQYGFEPMTPLDAPMGMRSLPASSRALAELIGLRGGRLY